MAANWFEKVPRIGSDEEFAALRKLLEGARYHEAEILGRLQIETLNDYQTPALSVISQRPLATALDALILLFCDCVYVDESALARLLPSGGLACMEALGLLSGETRRCSTAAILPVGPILTVCDRRNAPDLSPYEWPADIVYPANTSNSRQFQGCLPQTACDALLDIGTGTGIAALAGAGFAKHVWGTDVAARPVHFAEFTRRLNGIANGTILSGDLYEPVKGLTFDRIVAHPPYVPARKDAMIFRDAGEDGEQILRRIIEGLPEYLRPGGRFYSLVTAADCEGQPFEDRIRLWLGKAESEFDLVLVADSLTAPKDAVATMLANRNTPNEEVFYRQELWARRNVQFLFYGTVLIRRHSGDRQAFTARAVKGAGYQPQHADWLLDWHAGADNTAALLNYRPSISPRAELAVIHRVREGQLVPARFSLRSSGPFDTECIVPGWMAKVVTQCNGRTNWGEVLEWARKTGTVAPETTGEEFAGVLAAMGGSGLLHVKERPLE